MTEGEWEDSGWKELVGECCCFPMHQLGVSPVGHSGVFYWENGRNRTRKILMLDLPAGRSAAFAHSLIIN